jgi:predicted cupin superfamily sugar epimerase
VDGAATATVPAGVWMGAEAPGGWALVSCRCVPGFDFADLEFATEAALRGRWPESAAAVARLLP